jgi:hypothetical protein
MCKRDTKGCVLSFKREQVFDKDVKHMDRQESAMCSMEIVIATGHVEEIATAYQRSMDRLQSSTSGSCIGYVTR